MYYSRLEANIFISNLGLSEIDELEKTRRLIAIELAAHRAFCAVENALNDYE